MFKAIFGLFGQARRVKNSLVTIVEVLDRLDDDLDGDGKPEIENLKSDLTDWVMVAYHFAKSHFLTLHQIADRARNLADHVKGE